MKTPVIISIFCLAMNTTAVAATTGQHLVTLQIQEIAEISVSTDPGDLSIKSGTPGVNTLNSVTNSNTSYAISNNAGTKKITAVVSPAPNRGNLKIKLAAPTGASSAGEVVLSTTAQSVVTGIDSGAFPSNTITYKFEANASEGILNSTNVTVTLSLEEP